MSYQLVNSFCREFHASSGRTPHQPASAGFGVSDREFIHGVYQTVNSFTGGSAREFCDVP